MPTTPYARLLVSLDGGPTASGGIGATGGQVAQLSGESTANWTQQRWEIYDYPTGFACPAGWSTGSGGVYFYESSSTPPPFAIPASPSWGKYMLRLRVNAGLSNGVALASLLDESTALSVPSPVMGIDSIGYQETTQFSATKKWVAAVQDALTEIDSTIGGLGGVTSVSGTAPIVSSGGATPAISINPASGALHGSLSAPHYTLLAGATASATASTLALRGSAGQLTSSYFLTGTSKLPATGAYRVNGADQVILAARDFADTYDSQILTWDAANKYLIIGKDGLTSGPVKVSLLNALGASWTLIEGRHVLDGTQLNLGRCALVTPAFEVSQASPGADVEIDWSDGASQWIELDGDVEFTFVNDVAGTEYLLRVVRGSGGEAVTWTGNWLFGEYDSDPAATVGGQGTVYLFRAIDDGGVGLRCVGRTWGDDIIVGNGSTQSYTVRSAGGVTADKFSAASGSPTQVGNSASGLTTIGGGDAMIEVDPVATEVAITGPVSTIDITAAGTQLTGSLGFYGATPAAKPTVTGTRDANAGLASILTQLATLGLITDSTTAGTAPSAAGTPYVNIPYWGAVEFGRGQLTIQRLTNGPGITTGVTYTVLTGGGTYSGVDYFWIVGTEGVAENVTFSVWVSSVIVKTVTVSISHSGPGYVAFASTCTLSAGAAKLTCFGGTVYMTGIRIIAGNKIGGGLQLLASTVWNGSATETEPTTVTGSEGYGHCGLRPV